MAWGLKTYGDTAPSKKCKHCGKKMPYLDNLVYCSAECQIELKNFNNDTTKDKLKRILANVA